jgi:hypothetical protein
MAARENQQAEIYSLAKKALERQGEDPAVAPQEEALAASLDDILPDDIILA